jgi:malate/lactate dehydrogenase
MRQPAIVEELIRRPFKPFRLVLTDGTGVKVRHPELCMLGEHGTAIVSVPSTATAAGLPRYSQYHVIDVTHINRLKRLEPSSQGNGAAN